MVYILLWVMCCRSSVLVTFSAVSISTEYPSPISSASSRSTRAVFARANARKEAEAGFRATRLQRLADAAEKSKVKTRKTVRTMGDGDDQKTFQEVVEETVLPDPRWDAWPLERKYPEQYSRKHLNTKVLV